MPADKRLFRAAEIEAARTEASHPWNPQSKLTGTQLSRLGGLKRTGVSLARIPPGKESFCYHSHHFEEEWVYVLAGRAIAEIDGAEFEVGPGDFLAYPAPGCAHHLRNPFDAEFTYLMGGESREFDIADFPRVGKRMIRTGANVEVVELADVKGFP